jgi:hypothetical protein
MSASLRAFEGPLCGPETRKYPLLAAKSITAFQKKPKSPPDPAEVTEICKKLPSLKPPVRNAG